MRSVLKYLLNTYWPLSFYAMNTDNFYVINDEQVQ